ncbi:MAG TPA: multiheme c-type cytochrome [Terriglobales bacterium]|nr:multiheme c-type cytochrome [Terriglobales bacterium]
MATADRVQGSGWWPTKGTAAREDYVGPDACAQCHRAKVNGARKTPMAHASMPVADSEALRSHNRLETQIGPFHYQIVSTAQGVEYSVTDGTKSASVPLTWAFGMGEVGQTYVYEQSGRWYESRLSYYTGIRGLDFSPGHERSIPSSTDSALGRLFDIGETQRCFGCHTTASTTKGQFDPGHLIPGVTCEACHGPGAQHVAEKSMGAENQTTLRSIFNPAALRAVDAVEFCGACHRTAWDVALAGSKGVFNVRFQPYRLETSRCWGKGDARLVCFSCHDPHEPLVRDASSYDSRCMQCHVARTASKTSHDHHAVCRVSNKDCVTCHMPKQEIPGMHAKFTDHRIRIVHEDEEFKD